MTGSIFRVSRAVGIGQGTVVSVEVCTLGPSTVPFRVAWKCRGLTHLGVVARVEKRKGDIRVADETHFHPGQQLLLLVRGHSPDRFVEGIALHAQ